MKHRISYYLTFACVVLFGVLGLLLLLLGEKDPRESETENRMLTGFPQISGETLLNGSFMSDLESYLSDGMPARDRIVTETAFWMNKLSLGEDAAEENVFEELGDEDVSFPEDDSSAFAEPESTETPAPT